MALGHNPSIVTSGLVLCLDSGNPRSYSGTGTIWKDIGPNQHTGTLLNTPSYTAGINGYFSFDGVNQSLSFPSSIEVTTGDGFTICAMIKLPSTQINGTQWYFLIADRDTGAGDYETGVYGLNTTSFIFKENASTPSTVSLFLGTDWVYLCYGQNSSSQPFIYRNGILGASSTSIWPSATLDFTRIFARDNNSGYLKCDCSIIQVYDIGLTSDQVTQNFNALRGRYGI